MSQRPDRGHGNIRRETETKIRDRVIGLVAGCCCTSQALAGIDKNCGERDRWSARLALQNSLRR